MTADSILAVRGLADGARASFSELQEGLEVPYRLRRGSRQIDLAGVERRKHDELLTRASDGDIEPPMTALPVQRSEVHGNFPVLVRPVADGEEDHVSFVPLDVFEILHEEGLARIFAEEGFDSRMSPARFVEQILDQILLCLAEGHDTDGPFALLLVRETPHHIGHDGLGFGPIRARSRAVVESLGHGPEGQPQVGPGRLGAGKCEQRAVVVMKIAEGDEIFVSAAVMPEQSMLTEAGGDAFIENALELDEVLLVL